MEYDAGTAGEPLYEVCLIGSDVKMPSKGYFGVSAATGGLAGAYVVTCFLMRPSCNLYCTVLFQFGKCKPYVAQGKLIIYRPCSLNCQ